MIAEKWDCSREEMEAFALASHDRARAAIADSYAAKNCWAASQRLSSSVRINSPHSSVSRAARSSTRKRKTVARRRRSAASAANSSGDRATSDASTLGAGTKTSEKRPW